MSDVRDQESVGPPTRTAKRFEDLKVFQRAYRLSLEVHRASLMFPKIEQFGLAEQVRRASKSICANIAEGFKKRSPSDKARFLNIAQGSLEECQYYLILAKDLGFADTATLRPQLDEVAKLLEGYASAILNSNS